jgi:hypothetical protein
MYGRIIEWYVQHTVCKYVRYYVDENCYATMELKEWVVIVAMFGFCITLCTTGYVWMREDYSVEYKQQTDTTKMSRRHPTLQRLCPFSMGRAAVPPIHDTTMAPHGSMQGTRHSINKLLNKLPLTLLCTIRIGGHDLFPCGGVLYYPVYNRVCMDERRVACRVKTTNRHNQNEPPPPYTTIWWCNALINPVLASAIVKRFERRIARPGACGGVLSHRFGHQIEQWKRKTIIYTMALDGWWLPMDQDNQQSTDSRQKQLGGC